MTMAMTFTNHGNTPEASSWPGAAFVVEALLMLVFLVASLAVLMQLFFGAVRRGTQATMLQQAVTIAQNEAERFSADPTSVDASSQENGYDVSCSVTPEETDGGTLYRATITVSKDGAKVYDLPTARYVSGVK